TGAGVGVLAQEVVLPGPAAHVRPGRCAHVPAEVAVAHDGRRFHIGVATGMPGTAEEHGAISRARSEAATGEQQAEHSADGARGTHVPVDLLSPVDRVDLAVLDHGGGAAVDEVDIALDAGAG